MPSPRVVRSHLRVPTSLAALLLLALPPAARAAFTEAAALWGVAAGDSMSYTASFVDYDGDGDSELYVNNHWKGPGAFLRNDGAPPYVSISAHLGSGNGDRHDSIWADFDNDGTPDQYLIRGRLQPNELFMNGGGGLLEERAAAAGVADLNGRGRELTVLDADSDGWLDIFVANDFRAGFPRPNRLFVNRGDGTFDTLPNTGPLFEGRLHTASADYDLDGDPDLVNTNPPFQPGELWRNDGGLTFSLATSSAFPGIVEPFREAVSLTWADYDNDGDLDLLAAGGNRAMWDWAGVEGDSLRWYAESDPGELKTVFLVTQGDSVTVRAEESEYQPVTCWFGGAGQSTATFPASFAVADLAGVPPALGAGSRGLFLWSAPAAVGDSVMLALGGPAPAGQTLIVGGAVSPGAAGVDAWATAGYDPRPGFSLGNFTNRLFRNEGDGTFAEVTATAFPVNPADESTAACAWGDWDNDGWPDVYWVSSGNLEVGNRPNRLWRNQGDGTFAEVTATEGVAGSGRGIGDGAAWADVDGDGFLDLFVDSGGEHPPFGVGPRELFLNGGNGNHWLEIALRGLVSNGSGIGTRVRAVTAAGTFWAHRLGESDNCFSGPGALHLGLGTATDVDTLQIFWPSGTVSSYFDVAADRRWWAIEGKPLRQFVNPHLIVQPAISMSVVEYLSGSRTVTLDNFGGLTSVFSVSVEDCAGGAAPWLSASPDTGGVWPGGQREITVFADAAALAPGVYCGRVLFDSDSFLGPDTLVVNLTVQQNPATGAPGDPPAPAALALGPPRPNPSAGAVELTLAVPAAVSVDLSVYDVAGRRVATLLAGPVPAGLRPVRWDGLDDGGRRVAPGVYLVRARAGAESSLRRVVRLD